MLLMFHYNFIIREWENRHRQVAMACLVAGVYELENDRKHRGGQLLPSDVDTQTAMWWTHFGYELEEMLVDNSENGNPTIFGAVYSRKLRHAPTGTVAIVVAFRGTMMRTIDWAANLMTYLGILELHPRFREGLHVVERAVEEVGWERVCVTGHSKGAAIGLLVGRAMAENRKLIEAHLFNPPNLTLRNGRLLGWIPALGLPDWAAGTVELLHEIASRALTAITQKAEVVEEERRRFQLLSAWQPILYVHEQDPICSAYITYFDAARLCRIMSIPHSIRQSILSMAGVDSKPHHLIPCAKLVIHKRGIKEARNLRQWYDIPLMPHNLRQWYAIHRSDTQKFDASRIHVDDGDNNAKLIVLGSLLFLLLCAIIIVFGCLSMCARSPDRSCIN